MRLKKLLYPDILAGLGLLLLLSLPFALTDLDLDLAARFYHHGWPGEDCQPWLGLYRYGTWPGLILAAAGLIFGLGRWLHPRFRPWQRTATLLVLTMLIAPGVLINALGKGYYGRPRPRDVVQFGGGERFHKWTEPGVPGQGKSFPCGHASVGFFLVVLYFADRHRIRRWAWLGSGLLLGGLLGAARMAAGGHFASDVLWAGGLTYLTAAVLHHVILPDGQAPPAAAPVSPGRRFAAGIGLTVLLGLLAALFLLATPYDKAWQGDIPADAGIRYLRLQLPDVPEKINVAPADQPAALAVRARVRGFGFPKLKYQGRLTAEARGATLNARLELGFNRLVTERQGSVEIRVRRDLQWQVERP